VVVTFDHLTVDPDFFPAWTSDPDRLAAEQSIVASPYGVFGSCMRLNQAPEMQQPDVGYLCRCLGLARVVEKASFSQAPQIHRNRAFPGGQACQVHAERLRTAKKKKKKDTWP
jgi:hypothetical protein